jgi:uncharacterized protein
MITSAERPRIEAMWVVYLMLTLAALYAVIIAGMYFAQTRLLFPTMFAGSARVQLPESTQRLQVRTPDGESLAGVRIPLKGATADGAPTLLGFGGNAWNADATALTLHALFPHRNFVAFHYCGHAPSTGRPSARALFSDSLTIVDHLLQTQAGERILPVGFSIGAAVAAYFARHRPVAGLILVTPFDSLEAVAGDLYWWAPVGALLRNRMPTIEFVPGSNVPHCPDHSGARRNRAEAAERALARGDQEPRVRTVRRRRAQRSLRPSRLHGGGGRGAYTGRGGFQRSARKIGSDAREPGFLERLMDGSGLVRLVLTDWRSVDLVIASGRALDLALLNLVVWEKSNGGQGSLWRSQHELLPSLKKGEAPHINNVELSVPIPEARPSGPTRAKALNIRRPSPVSASHSRSSIKGHDRRLVDLVERRNAASKA